MPRSEFSKQEVAQLLEIVPLTQTEIANHLGVSQGQVSHYKYGRVKIPREHLKELRRLARDAHHDDNDTEQVDLDTRSGSQSYGEWLAEQIDALKLTQARLAEQADVSPLTVSNLINGKTEPQNGTRHKIQKALDSIPQRRKTLERVRPAPESDPSEPIVGNRFTEDEIKQAPDKLGVYVIHDKRGWPTYVGKGNIRAELKNYNNQKWATTHVAATFSYALIDNEKTALRIETIVIKFMADSLLVNTRKRASVAER